MERKFFGLLVGIDSYRGNVGNLLGCVNDINHINDYLNENVPLHRHIETLKNNDATRENIIRLFREHLCKARENDVVFFHYSGHGSRELSAPAFNPYFPGGKDETLVCYDSRAEGGFDLADKELAVLLWEIAKNNPHIVVSMDCCHSGSGTRDAPDTEAHDLTPAAPRQTAGRFTRTPRPLESYLNGFYRDMATIRIPCIPRSKHVLMAACSRLQKAWETKDHSGVFSTTLLEVLAKSGPHISYADLFVRCRTHILKQVKNQTPQFETYAHFTPYAKFLDGRPLERRARYFVYFEKDGWKMNCGAVHGLPPDPEKAVEVALYPQQPQQPAGAAEDKIAGYAKTISVGAQKSTLELDFTPAAAARYNAEIISLPVPPVPVLLEGDRQDKALVEDARDARDTRDTRRQSADFVFTDEPRASEYVLSVQGRRFLLRRKDTGLLIQGAEGEPSKCIEYIFSILEQVIRWERGWALQNDKTALDPDQVDFKLFEVLPGSTVRQYPGDSVTLNLTKTGDRWREIRAKVRVRNRTRQKLHAALVYFSRQYGIYIINNQPLEGKEDFMTLWGDGERDYLKLPDGINETVDRFKLVVSTEKVDDFLLIQKDLQLGKILYCGGPGNTRGAGDYFRRRRRRKITDDWFTKSLTLKTVRKPPPEMELKQ